MTTNLKPFMRQAIRTRYHGATNYKGSRISAAYEGGRIIMSYDSSLNSDDNHRVAAVKLAEKLGWRTDMIGGYFGNDVYWSQAEQLAESLNSAIVDVKNNGYSESVFCQTSVDHVRINRS